MIELNELTEELLQKYLEEKEFQVYLHPQYSVSKGRIVGAEALVRWIHEGQFISPAVFIPVLERKGLVTLVDSFVWESVFAMQAARLQQGQAIVPISVNVSREDFASLDLYETMVGLSKRYEVSPEYIHVEITESAFVEDSVSVYQVLGRLRGYGFMILIDDFGSGYSSLNSLKDIDADVVKLDMKFFDFTEKNAAKARDIISSVVQMAHRIGLGIIAEGVENTEQLDILKEEQCDVIQGYFFYRPMSMSDFDKIMRGTESENLSQTEDEASFGEECFLEARTLALTGDLASALTLAKRASTQINPESDAELYCNLENLTGVIYSSIGNELMAIDHYLAGLTVALTNHFVSLSGKFYNNIGAEYQRLQAHSQAIKFFELSAKELDKDKAITGADYEMSFFKRKMNLCVEYIALEDYASAKDCLEAAREYLDKPDFVDLRGYFLSIEGTLLVADGRNEEARFIFPEMKELILNSDDPLGIWDDMDRLATLAVQLEEYTSLLAIVDRMEEVYADFLEDEAELDIPMKIHEMRMIYYGKMGDASREREEERKYVELCKRLASQTKIDRATTIDYKIQLKIEHDENEEEHKQLNVDHLTGVGNRYKLEKDYKLLEKNRTEASGKLGVGIIDLDHLKDVNDNLGHLQGDQYLQQISHTIRDVIARTGAVYRYGSDKLVVLLVDVDYEDVAELADQIKARVEALQLENPKSVSQIQTVSQGYVLVEQTEFADILQLLTGADRQLYSVKNSGRGGYSIG